MRKLWKDDKLEEEVDLIKNEVCREDISFVQFKNQKSNKLLQIF